MEHASIEGSALVVGMIIAPAILRNDKTQQNGIGPRTIHALAISLLTPVVLILGLEKLLSSETIAAIIGGLVGFGLSRAKD